MISLKRHRMRFKGGVGGGVVCLPILAIKIKSRGVSVRFRAMFDPSQHCKNQKSVISAEICLFFIQKSKTLNFGF